MATAHLVEIAREGVGVLGPRTPAATRLENIARFADFVSESITRAAEQARAILHAQPEPDPTPIPNPARNPLKRDPFGAGRPVQRVRMTRRRIHWPPVAAESRKSATSARPILPPTRPRVPSSGIVS
ncbi:hypothetical protein Scinn_44290 [Streptomyces virginiae]|uniref:Uncharacterized protein n=1 Tax=Streptomyces virginiae TaxID=1961 RepID=A0ABQ3NQD4_STRVG|nr:hypothetical protein Scinn_44290 [Streptomyces virginiae]